jgi:hypothetical protein
MSITALPLPMNFLDSIHEKPIPLKTSATEDVGVISSTESTDSTVSKIGISYGVALVYLLFLMYIVGSTYWIHYGAQLSPSDDVNLRIVYALEDHEKTKGNSSTDMSCV